MKISFNQSIIAALLGGVLFLGLMSCEGHVIVNTTEENNELQELNESMSQLKAILEFESGMKSEETKKFLEEYGIDPDQKPAGLGKNDRVMTGKEAIDAFAKMAEFEPMCHDDPPIKSLPGGDTVFSIVMMFVPPIVVVAARVASQEWKFRGDRSFFTTLK